MSKRRVAIVVQRYGKEIIGGAEGFARELAELMQHDWDVTIITTCAKDYRSWKNEFPAGETNINGVKVRRFASAKERDFAAFSATTSATENRAFRLTPEEEKQHFIEQGPYCPELVEHLEEVYNQFDVFLFYTYLYYPTVFGIPKVADKAYLVSTAHDEDPFYFVRTYQHLLHSVRGIIYLTEEERELIQSLYNPPPSVKFIRGGYRVPEAIDFPSSMEKEFRQKYPFIGHIPYFLYVGRASPTKRCGDLFAAYARMTWEYKIPTKLLFAGLVDMDLPEGREDMVELGFVSEEEKGFLMQHAAALVNPSSLESLSMVILEAWRYGTPVIVNGESPVMRGHIERCSGGLYYQSLPMFSGLMAWAYQHPREGRILGSQGKEYVDRYYHWPTIKRRYLEEIV